MSMRAFHISKEGNKTEITEIITSLTISGEYRSCARMCQFGIVHAAGDERTWLIRIDVGDIIKVIDVDKVMFQGPVWTKSKVTETNEIEYTCNDYGIYLKKNKASYVFNKMTPEAIAKKVCGDFGIKIGSLSITGVPISRKFFNVSLYDIIMTAYSLANDKKYYCIFEGELMYMLEKGKKECTPLESDVNLLTASVSESLNNMVNRVRVYSKEDKLLKEFTEEADAKLYGYLTEIIRISSNDEDYIKKAKDMLEGVERKISVTNFGTSEYITGKKVNVTEPYTGLTGIFYIDGDEHNWKNGIYTNKLTLNFENMMDDKDSGSENK